MATINTLKEVNQMWKAIIIGVIVLIVVVSASKAIVEHGILPKDRNKKK